MVKGFFKYCGFRLSVSFEVQAYEAWESSKKAMLFHISENIQQISRPAFTLCLFLKWLKANILIRLLLQIKYKFSIGKLEPSRP